MSGIDFEEVLVTVGDKGRYQTVMFFILCIPATLPTAFLAFSNVFTNAAPDHWCKVPENNYSLNISENDLKRLTIPYKIRKNGEVQYDKCRMNNIDILDVLRVLQSSIDRNEEFTNEKSSKFKNGDIDSVLGVLSSDNDWKSHMDKFNKDSRFETVKCKYGWVYDRTYYDETLTTQFDLVCDDNWKPQTSTAMFYVGSLFGNVIFGWVADRWGRRRSILCMIVLEVIVSIATSFSNNYVTYTVMRALGGLFFPSLYQIPFILGIEMMGPSHRTFAGLFICLFFAASMSILSLMAYIFRSWYSLTLATSVPFLLLYSYYWIIPESPRWLVSQGRLAEAEKFLQQIAYYNGTKIPRGYLQNLQDAAIAKRKEELLQENGIGDAVKVENFCNQKEKSNVETTKFIDNDKNRCKNHFVEEKLNLRATVPGNMEQMLNAYSKKGNKRPYTFPLETSIAHKNNKFKSVDRVKEDADRPESDRCNLLKRNDYHKPDIVKSNQSLDNRRNCDEINNISDNNPMIMKSVSLQTDPIPLMEKNEATLLDIFRYPNIRKKFFILTFDWIANAVVYNGLSYNATNLGVNDFLAFFISAIVEVPSYLLAWMFMERWGRRWTLCITLGTGGIGCLCCMFVPEEQVWVTVGLAMLGKFGVAASFSVFYIFVGESFPTVIRSQAMGLASLLVSVGLLSFPYILQLGHISRVLPLIILGALSISGSVASIFLPETLNEPMPQTLEEGEAFGKDFKIFSWPRRRQRRSK